MFARQQVDCCSSCRRRCSDVGSGAAISAIVINTKCFGMIGSVSIRSGECRTVRIAAIVQPTRPQDAIDMNSPRRTPRRCVATLLAELMLWVALVWSVPAQSHHSFSAEYDIDWQLDLAGTVVGVAWRNPHIWMVVDVPGRRGVVRQWAVQFGPPNALEARGLKKTDLEAGSQVRIRGYRSKAGGDVAYSVELRLSDGRVFRTGGALDCPTASPGQYFGQTVPGAISSPR